MLIRPIFLKYATWIFSISLLLLFGLLCQKPAYALSFDTPVQTTQFSASSTTPTIALGVSGVQTITLTNNGPDNATNVIASFRPTLTTGVTVSSVSAPSGACTFSSPNWNCPAVSSVANGSSFNVTVTYSVSASATVGTSIKQGEIRVNSDQYTPCGGNGEYRYRVWGRGGNTQEDPASINSAFWGGNTQTVTSSTPAGSFHSEPTSVVGAWPITQNSPTGTYLSSSVAGANNDIYQPSSTTAASTVDKVITTLNTAPENSVTLPANATGSKNNRRAWELQSCIYVPTSTTVSPCSTGVDDSAYVTVNGTTLWAQDSYTGGIVSQSTTLSPGYHVIRTRILNRNASTSTETNAGGYTNLAGIVSGSVCSASSLDTLMAQAVPQNINIVASTLQLVKAWGANSSASDSATIGATTGGLNNTSSFTTAGGTAANSGTAVSIAVGNTITFPAETGTNITNYNTVLSCTANGGATANTLSGTNGQVSNTLVIGAGDAGKAIVCTYTNTRKSATLRLAKAWGANSITGNVASIGATTGFTNNTTAFTSTASTANNSNTVTVYAGDVGTLPAETMTTGTLANYNTTLSCDNGVTPSGTNGQSSNTLTIPNTVSSLITCTYTNTRKTANLIARKTWTNAKINDVANITTTGGVNNVNFSATANSASETDTATAITVYAGEVLTFAESFTTGSATNYNASLACTGNATALAGSALTINNADTNITCTYTNSRIAQSIRVDKQWTNSVTGHTASVTTTGGTNNPTFSSTAPTNTTGTAVTVYAGDVVTLPTETFGGGGSAIGYNTTVACTGGSPLASGTTGRTLTITNSTTATVCTYNNTKLPTITITKISNGGVRAFDFTGTNGFANQTITTVSSGVGVAGATQRLTAAGVSTTITETVPYGYALTNVACTGLGTGTATINYTTATVTLDTNATAAANNIACTFTNTAYGTTSFDTPVKTTRFSAVPDVPTIVRGFSGTQTIVMTNNGPDNATGVVVYYRPLVATGVTVTAVSSPAGACSFSSPDWVCPAISSVLNGSSFNITVTYSTTSAASLGTAQQGEIRVNSNEYTECGGVNEYKYSVWGLGGNSQPQPAPTNSAFWVGNTNTTTTATPSGAYSTESSDIFQAWPTGQDSPTGSYLYSPVAGQANNIYSPSSTTANPTVSKVLTGLNGQPENNVLLPQFGSTGTFTGDNKRAWEGQTCIYVPVATTVTPCLTMFDDAAYVSVKNLTTGITTVAASQSSYNSGAVLSGNVSVSPGYYVIKARISNRNTNGGNSEDAQGGYGQLAGIGSSSCSTAALDTLAQNAVPESINIIAPTTLQIVKSWGANTSTSDSASIGATTGGANNTSPFSTAGGTSANSGTPVAVAVGNTITFPAETGTNIANYNTVLSCTADGGATANTLSGTNGQVSNTLVIGAADLSKAIVCTYTNTRKSATLRLAKAWGANSITGNVANIGATTGLINNTSALTSTASTNTNGTAVTVYAGETATLAAETMSTGTLANYTTTLSCDNGVTPSGTNGQSSNTITIPNTVSGLITCTYTNTRKSATLRLAKAWGVNSIAGNVANIGATTGLINNTSALTSTASTDTNGTAVTVYAGETATLAAETMSTGTLANYTTTLSCDNGVTPSGTNGQSSNTITIPNTVSSLITCTYTNTRIAQNLILAKQWTNAVNGHTATVTTTGGTNNATFNSTSTGNNLTTGTAVIVYAGDVVTLPAETFGGGASASDYNTTLACTGGTTLSSGAVGRSITISNSTTATTCTYTNTGLSDMVPTLTYMPNTGIVGSPYYGKFTCTNNGITPATAGATCAITLPAGLSASCSPTVPTAGTVAVGSSVSCTVTGTPTTAGSSTFVLTTGASNDSNGGTTTGGNNQVSQAITIVSPTTAPTCSPGSTTNLLSSAGTELYYADNTVTPITNNFGLIASSASYVRTGSNFVVKGGWRWRNASPAAGSPAMIYQLIVNGTAYAQLVGTPSGQEVGTLTALNGATLDGGLTTMQLYDFSVSGLAALPIGVILPSTVTSISTLSMSFVSSTTPADDAGLAPTVLNACALPKLTLTKISQGGVGGFAFTGNNGFSNETITTTVAGTGVIGTTQTLSAVSTTTTITEAIPSGYRVTDISCTGLGAGSATPNFAAGSVALSDTALVYGANLACIFTNTKLPTITISKVSNGGAGTFSFSGTNGFSAQNITTSSAGVAVAGATQTLSTVSTTTTITEAIPSGYRVTDISCTGLGAGSATPNLATGSVSLNAAATAAGANINCTFTNTKLPTITISKISNGGTGTFSFSGTNGFSAQNITTSSAGVAVAGTTQILSAISTVTTITETIPSGYTLTNISCTGLGAGSATPNLATGSVSLNAAATAAGANINCTFTNNTGYTITGKVFYDNGKNAATPHNGIQEVDEQGIGNALVRLTDCGSTVYQTTTTNGAGAYSLTIPSSLTAGASLCVEEYQQPANLVSVSGNVGTTSGSYSLATDKVQFTLAAATNYTGVNFGDVAQSQLTGTGNQTISAGMTASYGHQFIAGTEGTVTFSTAQAPTPLLAWTSLVYIDSNCNALLDGGDTQVTASLNVVADQVVCLIQKVFSPNAAANGAQNVSTISASFVYTAPSAITANFSQTDTTIIMDSGLVLVKKVREVSSCPSTGADTNVFTTNNQALPNALIEYQIAYSNPSAHTLTNITINDMTPSFTTFRSASCYSTPSGLSCAIPSVGSGTAPSVGGVGSISWIMTNTPTGLAAGASGEVRFCVRVDQ